MASKSPVMIRILDTMNEKIEGIMALLWVGALSGEKITNIVAMLRGAEAVSSETPFTVRLRMWQMVVSVCQLVKVRAAAELKIADAVVEEFWKEVKLLEEADYHREFGDRTPDDFRSGVLTILAKRAKVFFESSSYDVGKSQRFLSFVFNDISWRIQLEKLAEALSRRVSSRRFFVVDGGKSPSRTVKVVYERQFEERYGATRKLHQYPAIEANAYLLCGVHAGRDTHGFTAKESLAYFAQHHRIPLTLKSATVLYTSHPDFLSGENAAVILLGEECDGKFVTLSYDEANAELHVGLASIDEVDRALRPRQVGLHDFSGRLAEKTYGKPSAGAVILP